MEKTAGQPAKRNLYALIAVILLAAVIIAGIVSVAVRHRPGGSVEVVVSSESPFTGDVYIGGGVAAPGIYPFKPDDTLDDLVKAAGGLKPGYDAGSVELVINSSGQPDPQRVNINTAEPWLLAALPGIGGERAQAIVDHRESRGPFRDTHEITDVDGIGEGIYQDIKDLITVGE